MAERVTRKQVAALYRPSGTAGVRVTRKQVAVLYRAGAAAGGERFEAFWWD